MSRFRPLASALVLLATPAAFAAATTQVKFVTSLGNINVTLLPGSAPNTVANFLSYVNSGAYDHSIIHRAEPGFVIQGGGYFIAGGSFNTIPTKPAINGEFKTSNTRGTLAMALSTGPNSGQDQWFFNLQNNATALDGTADGGPFTVFAQVSDAAGLAVMDSIAAQRIFPLPAFTELPVVNLTGNTLEVDNLIYVESIDAIVPAGSPDYSISASPAQLTLSATQTPDAGASNSQTTTLTVTASNGYVGTIALACGPLPTGVSCSFSPATVTFAAGSPAAQISLLTVSVAAKTALNDPPASSGSSGNTSGAGGFGVGAGSGLTAIAGLFGLACIAVVALSRSRRGLALVVLGVGFVAAAGGCGGTSSTTTPVTTSTTVNLPIRLTDGTTSHPAGVTVIIN